MNELTSADTLNHDEINGNELPKSLNILTILTFIGCGIGVIFTVLSPLFMDFSLKAIDKGAASGAELTQKQMADMEKSRHVIELTQSHLVPLLLVGSIGLILCFAGAVMMRKLKKDGFWIYVAGQVLPLAGNLAILGTAQFTGVSSYFAFILPLVFIYLYSRQRKYLIK